MKKFMNMFILALTIMAGATSLTACNTIDGAGQDVENLGEEISD